MRRWLIAVVVAFLGGAAGCASHGPAAQAANASSPASARAEKTAHAEVASLTGFGATLDSWKTRHKQIRCEPTYCWGPTILTDGEMVSTWSTTVFDSESRRVFEYSHYFLDGTNEATVLQTLKRED